MTRTALVCAALLLAPAALAQTGFLPTSAPTRQSDLHFFEMRDGQVYLDGRLLPNAVPEGLDVRGENMSLEYNRALTPMVEIDGRLFILHNEKLVPYQEEGRSGTAVYMLGPPTAPPVDALPDDEIARLSEQAYMRDVAEHDQALFTKLQREQRMDRQALQLADRIRGMAPGPERTAAVEDLRGQLAEIFRLKQETRRDELARAQEQVDQIRAVLDARDARRDAIIDQRLRELTGGW